MRDRKHIQAATFRSFTDAEKADKRYYASLSPAERLDMMWQLAIDAWTFTGGPVAESRLPRHVVHRAKS
jgi:hypothetical protein